jgi:hypothetical protein
VARVAYGNCLLLLILGGSGPQKGRGTGTFQEDVQGHHQEVAEDYARRQPTAVLVESHAAWRQQPLTEQQLALLRKWRVPLPLAFTRGMAADVLTVVMGDWE